MGYQYPWIFSDTKWKLGNQNTILGRRIYGYNMAGSMVHNTVEVCPGTVYWAIAEFTSIQGSGQLGVTWSYGGEDPLRTMDEPSVSFSGENPKLEYRFVAPMEARYGTLWMYTNSGSSAIIKQAWFGPAGEGELSVWCNLPPLREGKPLTSEAVGVNVNYLTDHKNRREGRNRGQPFTEALKDMKVGSLRYPGGEKADTYFYSPGPDFWPPRKGQSQPTLSRQSPDDWPSNDPVFYNQSEKKWANPPMTFDEFMDICDKVKAEPYIVIAWDSINKIPDPKTGGTFASADEHKKHAMNWVYYCKQYYPNVTRFEFSNESYLNPNGRGATAQDYANNLQWYAQDLKTVNKDLKVGANGPNNLTDLGKFDEIDKTGVRWWPTVLKQCADYIDFLVIHPYINGAWDWSAYEAGAVNMVYPIQEANAAIDKYGKGRDLRICITEVAPIDYGTYDGQTKIEPKWIICPANLGHALVIIDQMASTLMQRRVDCTIFWNTRWNASLGGKPRENEQTFDNSVVNTLFNESNYLTACGQAVSFVGAFFRDGLPVFSESNKSVKVFALTTTTTTRDGLRLVLINKTGLSVKQVVNIGGFRSTPKPLPQNKWMYVFTGQGITDVKPSLLRDTLADWSVTFGTAASGADQLFIELRPYSATAFELLPLDTPPVSMF